MTIFLPIIPCQLFLAFPSAFDGDSATGAMMTAGDSSNLASGVDALSTPDAVLSGAQLQKLSALVRLDRSLVPQIPQIGAIKDFQPDEGTVTPLVLWIFLMSQRANV